MSKRGKVLWAAAGLLLLLFFAAVNWPNLVRPRGAPQPGAFFSEGRGAQVAMLQGAEREQLAFVATNALPDSPIAAPDRKLIHNAELGLTVADVRTAAEHIRKITEAGGGQIDNLEITEGAGGSLAATLVVRVPAAGLENALAEYKKLAMRTDREQVSTRDVTREFYDNDAHLRNLRAEEQQYLTIMKQARSVAETLAVSEKLSDVRDRIERLQTQIQVMTHDVEMSAVSIALAQESDTRVFGIHWRPLYNAKVSLRELLVGLGEWMDWVIAVFIKLPLIFLWTLTVGAITWVVWKIGRAVWLRARRAKNAGKAQ